MIDLYTAATGNGRRPAVMLEECGLSYQLRKIDLAKGEQKKPNFLALNPVGAIPVLVDHDGQAGRSSFSRNRRRSCSMWPRRPASSCRATQPSGR